MSRSLIGQSVLYTAANLTTRLAALVSLAILPRILSPEEYGVIGLLTATSAFVNILLPLEISQGLARLYARSNQADQPRLAGTSLIFTAAMLTGGAVVGLVFAPWLSAALFGQPGFSAVFRIAILLWTANCLFLFFQNQFRWSFRPQQYAAYSLAFAVFTIGGTILMAATWQDQLLGAVVGWSIAAAATTVAAAYSLRSTFAWVLDPRLLKRMLKFAAPLVPASLAIIVTTYFSRIILTNFVDLREVGRFVFAAQLASVPSLVVLGLQSAITPHVMAHYDRPATARTLAHLAEGVILTGLAGSFALAACVDELLPIAGYGQYAGIGQLVAVLAPALLLQQIYIFFPGFAIAEKTARQAAVSIAGGVVTVVLTLGLVAPFGVQGAGVAMLVSTLVFISAWVIQADRLYSIPVRWFPVALLGAAMAVASQIRWMPDWSGAAVNVIAVAMLWAAAAPLWLRELTKLLRESR